MKSKILQILYDLKHQPVISGVTLIGTSLSIFLIMIVVMIQQVPVLPFAPESNRPRLLLGVNMHVKNKENGADWSARLNQHSARKIYDNLDGIEYVSFYKFDPDRVDVIGPSGEMFLVDARRADANYFNVFDHALVKGRYYTKEEADALMSVAVITESTARRLFGDIEPIGQTFQYDFNPYTVVGVVKDNSSLATLGYGEVFIPTSVNDGSLNYNPYTGAVAVAMLVKEGVDFRHIRDQVIKRYAEYSTEIAPDGFEPVYHEQPYDIETVAAGVFGSNSTPDTESGKKTRYLVYAILLLVPAINLSSMLHSRMRRRISEIGVRRAFGCTRLRIITDIIGENFIVTVIGGAIGLLFGIVFAKSYTGLFSDMGNIGSNVTPPLSVLLNWQILLTAIGVCFILNMVSAAIPAWQASRVNVVDAINANK